MSLTSARSRSTPPAAGEDSCWSSPMRRTLAPRAMAWAMRVSRSSVEAMPASSQMISVPGPIVSNHVRAGSSAGAGGPPRVPVSWTSLAKVSVGESRSAARTSAALAVGANPITVPPSLRQAAASVAIAVVFPVPAGASASCTRAPEVAIACTNAFWPSLRSTPLLACCSSIAKPMLVSVTARPPRSAGGGQDSPLGGQDVSAGVGGGAVAGVDAGAVAAAQQRGFVFVGVGGAGQGDAVLIKGSGHDAVDEVGAAGVIGVAQHPLGFGAHMIGLPGGPGFGDGGQHLAGRVVDPFGGDRGRGAGPVGRWRAATIAVTARLLPITSMAWARHTWRCSPSERGSCLAARVSRVACWDSASISTAVGSRPWVSLELLGQLTDAGLDGGARARSSGRSVRQGCRRFHAPVVCPGRGADSANATPTALISNASMRVL